MPQLDKISFMSQYLWLTIFFFLFYYFVLNFFVVFMFKSLTLRSLLNELYYFRMFKVDFDKGILSMTNAIHFLYYTLVYSFFFYSFAYFLKSRTFFFKNIGYLNNFFDISLSLNAYIANLKINNYKNINNINL